MTLTLDQTLCSFWKGLEENVRGGLQLRGKLSWEAEHRWFLLCSSLNTMREMEIVLINCRVWLR